mmetsp:Transcript_97637/g.209494  ORF Transcript_97637/g.209494 Transcript_97637/m.209494 type:complete len:237 (-) Transcript_97637:241-951(-)
MLQKALAWGSSYLDNVLLSYHGCCCSSAPGEEAHGKCDLVVPTDWDTYENHLGYAGQFSEPAAIKGSTGEEAAGQVRSAAAVGDASPWQTPRCPSPGVQECGGYDPVEDGEDAATREAFALRELMKKFVQDLVRGKAYELVIEDGQTEPCKLSITSNLMYLQLEAAGVTHDIPLRNVKDVCPGRLLASRFAPVNLDDLCNTLVLRDNKCVTFRLPSIRDRDEFTKCVKVLALALDQ